MLGRCEGVLHKATCGPSYLLESRTDRSICLSATTLEYADGRLTAHNGKRARMPIVEPSRSADAAGGSRARVDCRRPSRPSGIGECPDRSLASPQVDQASLRDLRPLQTESAVARKSLAQNVAVAQSGSFQARQLSHAALPSATLIGHGQSPQTRRRARDAGMHTARQGDTRKSSRHSHVERYQ